MRWRWLAWVVIVDAAAVTAGYFATVDHLLSANLFSAGLGGLAVATFTALFDEFRSPRLRERPDRAGERRSAGELDEERLARSWLRRRHY